MKRTDLKHVSTLELLIELMYDGQSGLVPNLKDLEPIPVADLIDALVLRADQDVGLDFDSWYQWYLSDGSPAAAEEKDILENLLTFKRETDAIIRRIVEQRGGSTD